MFVDVYLFVFFLIHSQIVRTHLHVGCYRSCHTTETTILYRKRALFAFCEFASKLMYTKKSNETWYLQLKTSHPTATTTTKNSIRMIQPQRDRFSSLLYLLTHFSVIIYLSYTRNTLLLCIATVAFYYLVMSRDKLQFAAMAWLKKYYFSLGSTCVCVHVAEKLIESGELNYSYGCWMLIRDCGNVNFVNHSVNLVCGQCEIRYAFSMLTNNTSSN